MKGTSAIQNHRIANRKRRPAPQYTRGQKVTSWFPGLLAQALWLINLPDHRLHNRLPQCSSYSLPLLPAHPLKTSNLLHDLMPTPTGFPWNASLDQAYLCS
ncbi:hypothetical protein ATANTOWER_027891 [Ataeniobius toweri]|uniref:Uncharacterized protein n=1 Tax=Ataeniobius toweri TaxID=208326 RepID=A0ABU7C0U1_9TELE|nr:hypothetical protein [Ataeniobius toweri]